MKKRFSNSLANVQRLQGLQGSMQTRQREALLSFQSELIASGSSNVSRSVTPTNEEDVEMQVSTYILSPPKDQTDISTLPGRGTS